MGFLLGLLGGTVVAVIIAVVVAATRRTTNRRVPQHTKVMDARDISEAITKAARPVDGTTVRVGEKPTPEILAKRGTGTTSSVRAGGVTTSVPVSRNTIIVAEMEQRGERLARSIQDVRDLLLKLATVVGATEKTSGEAAAAFNSAKDIIHQFDFTDPTATVDLAEAQAILIREIDRVVRSNAKLHGDLEKANQGIAEQRRQIDELRVQARVDSLTRIPNRAAFDERLVEYIGLFERNGLGFTLMLLDIDHFKKVNDTYGHINGDRILRGVAAKVADGIRTNDFAARYGGEEFSVIFPGTALKDAKLVAERMRVDIEKTNFRMDDHNVKITVSGGLAECRKGMTPEQIIAAADNALYHAKESGRNLINI